MLKIPVTLTYVFWNDENALLLHNLCYNPMGTTCSTCSCHKNNNYVHLTDLGSRPVRLEEFYGNCIDIPISAYNSIEYIRFDTGFYIKPKKCALIVQKWVLMNEPSGVIHFPYNLQTILLHYIGSYRLNVQTLTAFFLKIKKKYESVKNHFVIL